MFLPPYDKLGSVVNLRYMPDPRTGPTQDQTGDGRRLAALLRLLAELGKPLDEDDICHQVL